MSSRKDQKNDEKRVLVIGAGASGLMAAGLGAEGLLLEKTRQPGQKILIRES
jgi:predicted flavoprotein YhiN